MKPFFLRNQGISKKSLLTNEVIFSKNLSDLYKRKKDLYSKNKSIIYKNTTDLFKSMFFPQ